MAAGDNSASGGKRDQAALSVLVPRPQSAQAQNTARALRRLGFAPFILPLSQIEPLPFQLPAADAPQFSAVLATSANAFSPAAAEALPAALKTLPLYCVGGETAKAAMAQGFAAPRLTAENAAALIKALQAEIKPKEQLPRLLYLAGKPRRPQIEDFLSAAQLPFHTAELYASRPLSLSAADKANLPKPLGFILLYSSQTAAALPALSAHIGAQTQILCLSARISAAVPPQWRRQTRIAAAPNQAALLALLPALEPCAKTGK